MSNMKIRCWVLFCIVILLSVSHCVHADEMSDEEKYKELAWQAINLIDYGQTRHISNNCGPDGEFYETNTILGKCPDRANLPKYFLGAAILHYVISANLPREQREIWQNTTLFIQGGMVLKNVVIGVNIEF